MQGESPEDHGSLLALANQLRSVPAVVPGNPGEGSGIVICAGGAQLFVNAYVLISILRSTHGCTLPIEVWHFGSTEMSPAMAALLAEMGVRLVDAVPIIRQTCARIEDGWQLKPFAILYSRFAEVLLLDADQVPVQNPAALFDWPEYRYAGAVFWPDILKLATDHPLSTLR